MSLACRYLSRRRRLPTSINRPRREWWSLRCSRRCSVSSLMRAVSSATWTSVEPVSASPRPYSATISRFLSAVSVIEPETVAAETSLGTGVGDLARLHQIALHLVHEGVHGVEALLAAHALEEGDPQCLAVEVSLEPDQVRLHEQAAAAVEGGPHADVDGRRIARSARLGRVRRGRIARSARLGRGRRG